ncbi:hypothetical protein SKAU_G00015990 [Synaphobranchus kaupii]|uniref:Uncharacterized protein n=1 Tax=Synaphobranchus kaupii TaxID=118154 RepID=A0A9Q1GAW6_SYNKA|nr:hypothetical protein SKAU_G00015990 [Synaphobranchus kaupii]
MFGGLLNAALVTGRSFFLKPNFPASSFRGNKGGRGHPWRDGGIHGPHRDPRTVVPTHGISDVGQRVFPPSEGLAPLKSHDARWRLAPEASPCPPPTNLFCQFVLEDVDGEISH